MEVWGGIESVTRAVRAPGLDAWVCCRPHAGDDVGGDIHYLSSCASGHITRSLVADVSGHGASVADVAEKLRALMRRYVNLVDQSRLVRGLNSEFHGLSRSGGFATAVVMTYFAPRRTLSVTLAGHPQPIIYRGRERRWSLLEMPADGPGAANVPLGVMERATYDQATLRLDPGDMVVLYTDALIEARGPEGRVLGQRGLVGVLEGIDATRPEQIPLALLERVASMGLAGRLGDDATVMVLSPNDLGPRRSPVHQVRGALDAIRAMLRG